MVTTWKQYIEFVAHHERLNKPVYISVLNIYIDEADPKNSSETTPLSKRVLYRPRPVTRKPPAQGRSRSQGNLAANNSSADRTLKRPRLSTRVPVVLMTPRERP